MALTFESRPINKNDTRCVSSNYFGDKCKKQTDEYIEDGLWVTFCADCIGHTRARMFENEGERYLVEKYGESNLQAVCNDYGSKYYRLR